MELVHPLRRRVTALNAPGGFGKTTLLAESCRAVRDAGTLTAWVTLDMQDAPQVLDTYLAFAFLEAGLDVLDLLDTHRFQDDPLEHRTALLVRAIERYGAPCVLVLDELERLDSVESMALLNYLLRWGSSNLHVAIGCRELPAALDIASLVFAGRAKVLSVDDLRFSTADVARFFGSRLSRREIRSLARESSGWPIALRILQNERDIGTGTLDGDGGKIAENWVESRMWRGVAETERQLLLDVGLFEWVDAALLDEVLQGSDLKRQVEAMPAVNGLLESTGGAASDRWRLHPLIREHCARRRIRETPERFRSIHRRIAEALEDRGDAVAAMHHASEAGDAKLVGDILRRAGGLRLWLREGFVRLHAADRYLTPEIMDANHDLALAHCVVLILSGQLGEARRVYRATASRLEGSGIGTGVNRELELDDNCTRGLLSLYGCDPVGSQSVRTLLAQRERLIEEREIDPLVRANFETALCIAYTLKGEFDASLELASRAKHRMGGNPYLCMFVDLQCGQVAMARGRVSEATNYYREALYTARANFLRDPGPTVFGETLMRELDLERNRVAGMVNVERLPRSFVRSGTPLASYAAAAGVAVDVTLQRGGVEAALAMVEEMRDYARGVELPALARYLGALRVSLLVTQGQLDDAEQAWRGDRLPEQLQDCLDLENQSWREMEALACTQLRLLTARGSYAAARRFAHSLDSVAAGRDLRRTRMRGLALWIVLEHTAGAPEDAEGCLERYLELYAETDYSRPLTNDGKVCLPLLSAWIERHPNSPLRDGALRLQENLNEGGDPHRSTPHFSVREMEVLQRLGEQRDREIAAALNLTQAGVRYHVAKIFEKLSVRGRRNAVRRAQEIGLLPDS